MDWSIFSIVNLTKNFPRINHSSHMIFHFHESKNYEMKNSDENCLTIDGDTSVCRPLFSNEQSRTGNISEYIDNHQHG